MIAFEGLLAPCAVEAGIKVPDDLENYSPEEYIHWHVYRMSQLGAPMPHSMAHWDNAAVIAKLPEDVAKTATFADLEMLGCAYGWRMP